MTASHLSFRAAVSIALAGMLWGLQMAISQDHSAAPAHAHLNLLGFVSLFLFGIFYHLHPAIDRSRWALAQVWAWIAASVVMAIGVGLIHAGRAGGEPLAAASSILAIADMLLFAWLVFRRAESARTASPRQHAAA